jgi:hypothetical protein
VWKRVFTDFFYRLLGREKIRRRKTMKIIKDGDKYLVRADNFVDLQESKDYFFIGEEEYREFVKEAAEKWRDKYHLILETYLNQKGGSNKPEEIKEPTDEEMEELFVLTDGGRY